MIRNKQLTLRHDKAKLKLKKAFEKIPKNKDTPVYKVIEKLAETVGISRQTAYNYLNGNCKDGFITEALTNECINLKHK